MALTVSQIAERIASADASSAEKSATVERLRYWTREGLLETKGDLNPGTGRRRFYEEGAVFDAAVLNALARQGVPVGRERYSPVVMLVIAQAKQAWKKQTSEALFLEVVDWGKARQGSTKSVHLHQTRRELIPSSAYASVVLNLTRIFRQLEQKGEQHGRP